MNLGNLLPNAVFRLDQLNHQSQVESFEGKLNPQSGANKSFVGNLFKVSQDTVSWMVGSAIKDPASTLVYALLATPFLGVNAKPLSPATSEIAQALQGCLSEHRPDDFPLAYTKASCLGRMADDICSDRAPGSSSRYNFAIKHDESNELKRNVCRQLLGRSAGIDTSISSAHKTPEEVIRDVVRDVKAEPFHDENIDHEADHVIEIYGLRGEVDDSIVMKSDVWAWVAQHRPELEDSRGHVDPFELPEFIHAASNRYRESGDIRNQSTYRQVLEGIHKLDLKSFKDEYYDVLAQRISEKLYLWE